MIHHFGNPGVDISPGLHPTPPTSTAGNGNLGCVAGRGGRPASPPQVNGSLRQHEEHPSASLRLMASRGSVWVTTRPRHAQPLLFFDRSLVSDLSSDNSRRWRGSGRQGKYEKINCRKKYESPLPKIRRMWNQGNQMKINGKRRC